MPEGQPSPQEVLGESIIVGLRAAEPTHATPLARWGECHYPVNQQLAQIDWDALPALLRLDIATKGAVAERLASFALDDALILMQNAAQFIEANYQPEAGTIANALKCSKGLLSIAGLKDGQKAYLLDILFKQNQLIDPQDRDMAKRNTPLVWRHTPKGNLVVDWSPEVSVWIDERKAPHWGCPAHSMVIEIDGKKVNVLSTFWETMVDKVYDGYSPQLLDTDVVLP